MEDVAEEVLVCKRGTRQRDDSEEVSWVNREKQAAGQETPACAASAQLGCIVASKHVTHSAGNRRGREAERRT